MREGGQAAARLVQRVHPVISSLGPIIRVILPSRAIPAQHPHRVIHPIALRVVIAAVILAALPLVLVGVGMVREGQLVVAGSGRHRY